MPTGQNNKKNAVLSELWLATTPDSVLQAAATDQAAPALEVNIIFIALYEVILLI